MSTIARTAIRRFEPKKMSVLALADAARDRGDWDQAAKFYQGYLDRSPRNFSIWVQLGHALKEGGHRAEALTAYSRALALKPDDPDLLLNLGHLQKLLGHREQALRYYRQSLKVDGNVAAIEELRAWGEWIPPAAVMMPASKRMRAGLARRLNNLRFGGLLYRANLARDHHDWVKAAELYRNYLDATPRDFAIWVQLGHALKEAGRHNEALGAYQQALALDSDDADLLLNLGHLYKIMGRGLPAAEFYRKSTEMDPAGPAAAELVALTGRQPLTYQTPSQFVAAIQQDTAHSARIARKPRWAAKSSRRALQRADEARDQRDWTTAATQYQTYLRFRPDHFAIWVQLGHALKEGGRPQDALEAYKQALRLNSADACDLLTNFGHLFNSQHHIRQASAFYGLSTKQQQLLEAIDSMEMLGMDASLDVFARQDQPAFQPNPEVPSKPQSYPIAQKRRIAVFTIASKNYLAYVRVLMRSLAEFNPDYDLYLCLADKINGQFDPAAELFKVIECQNLGIPHLQDMALRYDVMEFNTALKPFMFQWMIKHTDYDSIIYLDPDIRVFSKFDHLELCLESGPSVVMTPHITRPLEDKKNPNDYHMLQSGTFNLGFVAINRCDEALFFVNWWGRKLETGAYADFSRNLFTDQRWCDLAPSILNDLLILKTASYNVAYWNLAERTVCCSDGRWYANAEPLVFFHFSGVNAGDQSILSKHQNRFDWNTQPALKRLFDEYRAALLAAGWEQTKQWPYYYGSTREGLVISPLLRAFYRHYVPDPAVFEATSATDMILGLCKGEEQMAESHAEERINRLMAFVHASRPDLQAAFNLNTGDGRRAFREWFASSAQRDYQLPSDILQIDSYDFPESIKINGSANNSTSTPFGSPYRSYPNNVNSLLAPAAIKCFLDDQYISSLMYLIWLSRPDLQDAFDIHTAEGQRAFAQWYVHSAKRELSLDGRLPTKIEFASGLLTSKAVPNNEPAAAGATLIGYAHAVLGMGEHVRMSAAALDETGVPYGVYNFNVGVETRQGASLEHGTLIQKNTHAANIFHINADQMLLAYAQLGHGFFVNRYNIGYWAWELAKSPIEWQPVVNMIDEIWAPSRFIQDAFAEVSRAPVMYMPLCVSLPHFKRLDREVFNIPQDAYVFLYTFDFLSYMDRKNPLAAISAFLEAFPERDSKTCLVLKILNGDANSDKWKQMLALIGDDHRIIVINKKLSRAEVLALFDACDCFVSLHRSEGFGRGPAEAMYLGKPVIVTNYSGNTDFTRSENSCLVNYKLIAVKEGQYPFYHGQFWADPDVEHAAWHMQRLFNDRTFAHELGARATAFIHENYSQTAIGKMYESRLRELRLV